MGVWTLLIPVVCPPAQTSLTPTLFQALCWVMETPVLGEEGSQCSQSDHLQRVRKHFSPFAGSLCSSLTHPWMLIPWPLPDSKGPPAQPDSLEQRDKGLVRLPPHLGQLQGHRDAPPPALGLVGAGWGCQRTEPTPEGEQSRRASGTWKQNCGGWEPLVTGGSCRKSPQMMSWIPPNGLFRCRMALERSKKCFRGWGGCVPHGKPPEPSPHCTY